MNSLICRMPSKAAKFISTCSQTNEVYAPDSGSNVACMPNIVLTAGFDQPVGDQMAHTSNELNPFKGTSCINICHNRYDHEGDSDQIDVPFLGDVFGMEQGRNSQYLRSSIVW